MRISSHAAKRLRQRLGIPKRGAIRHAQTAFNLGQIVQSLDNEQRAVIEFRNVHYIFGYDHINECPVLVTVLTNDTNEKPWYLR